MSLQLRGSSSSSAADESIVGAKTFTSLKGLRSTTWFGLGGGVGSARNPFYQNSYIDGSTMNTTLEAGAGDDMVGHQINVKFQGGFASHWIQPAGGMTSGSAAVTLTTGTIGSAVVGWWVLVLGAGASGGNLKARIATITDSTHFTLTTAAGTTVSGAAVRLSLAPDPTFLFGANDFFTTGTATNDISGITDLWGRLAEVHVYTPNASLVNVYGLVGQTNNDAAGVNISGWQASVYATAPAKTGAGGTTANAAALYVSAPAAGVATSQYAIYQSGTTGANFFGANSTFNAGVVVGGGASAFKVLPSVTTPNMQAAAAGVYAGTNGGAPAVELADGTNNIRLDNTGGVLRVLRAGVASNMELDASGNLKTKGGVGFFNTAPTTSKPSVTGSRAGNAALASLLTTLAAYGLVTDSSTA